MITCTETKPFHETAPGALRDIVTRMAVLGIHRHRVLCGTPDGNPVIISSITKKCRVLSYRGRVFAVEQGPVFLAHSPSEVPPGWMKHSKLFESGVAIRYDSRATQATTIQRLWETALVDATYVYHNHLSPEWMEKNMGDAILCPLDSYAVGNCVLGARRLVNEFLGGHPILTVRQLLCAVRAACPNPSHQWHKDVNDLLSYVHYRENYEGDADAAANV